MKKLLAEWLHDRRMRKRMNDEIAERRAEARERFENFMEDAISDAHIDYAKGRFSDAAMEQQAVWDRWMHIETRENMPDQTVQI